MRIGSRGDGMRRANALSGEAAPPHRPILQSQPAFRSILNPAISSPLLLGIDTGGTYTDAVVFDERRGVIAKAKALTTRHDLAVGIAAAVDRAMHEAKVAPSSIGLVSLSTTLATNALVEGQGARAGLVMIGFSRKDLARDGLGETLGSDPVVFLTGGHDVHGRETPLEVEPLSAALPGLAGEVSAFAVAGYFAVRNPEHELRVRDMIRARTALPVTCSHELSARLGGPRRALTTLLNARLVTMIDRLVGACERFVEERGIRAPLMVVRGDGALISAAEATLRPIETILSGPAASLVGARHLTGLDQAVVSDIGGTTTDIAVLDAGLPRLDGEGAVVGGHRTMVEAVAMRTFGIGGDSEVNAEERGLSMRLTLGPRRLVPLSLAASMAPDAVLPALERQANAMQPGRLDGRFAMRTGLPESHAAGLPPQERDLYQRLTGEPKPLGELLSSLAQRATLDRLTTRGLAHIAGFTPSDAMHVLGFQSQWNREAGLLGARLFSRRRDGAGRPFAATPEAMSEAVVAQLTRQSSEAVLTACLHEDGADDIDAGSASIDRALRRAPGIVRFSIGFDRPLIGLGASAPVYYPAIGAMLDARTVVPEHADVANAVGAVVGQIRVSAAVTVTCPEEGVFMAGGAVAAMRFATEDEAFAYARETAVETARAAAMRNGAAEPVIRLDETIEAPEIEGSRRLVEARFLAVATGRPRLTRG